MFFRYPGRAETTPRPTHELEQTQGPPKSTKPLSFSYACAKRNRVYSFLTKHTDKFDKKLFNPHICKPDHLRLTKIHKRTRRIMPLSLIHSVFRENKLQSIFFLVKARTLSAFEKIDAQPAGRRKPNGSTTYTFRIPHTHQPSTTVLTQSQ